MAVIEKIKNTGVYKAIAGFFKKISDKIKSIPAAKRKNFWENVRMIIILMFMAAPFIFLIVMIMSYFL